MRQTKTRAFSWMLILVMVFSVISPGTVWKVNAEETNPNTISDTYVEKLEKVTSYLKENNAAPAYGSEWVVMQQARTGKEDMNWYHTYYDSVWQKIAESGSASLQYLSDNARTVIALSAIGADPRNVAGQNLLEPLADYNAVSGQYVTVAVYTLIALDSKGYDVPNTSAEVKTTRENLINCILDNFMEEGYIGYEYDGASYPDMDSTAMALQALAPYNNDEYPNVKALVEKSLAYLSAQQDEQGAYGDYDKCCTTAQVLCALSVLGIDPEADARFVKEGNSVVDALLSYCDEEGAIYSSGSYNKAMSSVQAAYALTAYKRLKDNKNSLYNMSDAVNLYAVDGEVKEAKEASCTAEGYTGDTVCSVCGTKIAEGISIAKKEHTPVTDAAVAPTETAEGKTEGSHCAVCNTVLTAQQVIPATGKQTVTEEQTVTEKQTVAVPKKTSVSKVTSPKKKQIKVTWKKKSNITGYQIQVSTSSKFKKSKTKSYKIGKAKTSRIIKSLKSNKKYYVRIRTYKTAVVNGRKVTKYSSWSAKKTVKVK